MRPPDPLCPIELHEDYCDLCRRLRTARLQGVVAPPPHHAPLCWCEDCMGTAVGPT